MTQKLVLAFVRAAHPCTVTTAKWTPSRQTSWRTFIVAMVVDDTPIGAVSRKMGKAGIVCMTSKTL